MEGLGITYPGRAFYGEGVIVSSDNYRQSALQLPRAYIDGLFVRDVVDTRALRKVPDRKAVRSVESGEVYSIVSDKYTLVQHSDVAEQILNGLQEADNIRHWEAEIHAYKGRMYGTVIFGDREFQQLKEYPDPIRLGFRFANSYDKETGIQLSAFSVRMICINWQLYGEMLKKTSVKHIGQVVTKVGDFVHEILTKYSEIIPSLFQEAYNEQLQPYITPLSACKVAGIPLRYARQIVENRTDMTRYELYNEITAYITHEYTSNRRSSEVRAMELLENANKIITMTSPQLRDAYMDLLAKEKKKEREITVKAGGSSW